jgi:uncharacterized protein (DUF1684 family)
MIGLLVILNLVACEKPQELSPQEKAYIEEIDAWHERRVERLTSKTGWLSLVGLYWLKEGENRIGSDVTNDIKFPKDKSPGFIGSVYLEQSGIRTEIAEGVNVLYNDSSISSINMRPDVSGSPTILHLDSLSWYIIKRGQRYAIRLRDSENKSIRDFSGIERYPVDTTWRVEAKLELYNPPKKIEVPNITGKVGEELSPGALVFEIRGKEYRLDPLGKPGGKNLFVIFADKTNGEETYGAGRFLYAAMPGEDGKTILDFNKAYSPPCAFTRFATCPLPPKQNILPIKVTAGEKNYAHH